MSVIVNMLKKAKLGNERPLDNGKPCASSFFTFSDKQDSGENRFWKVLFVVVLVVVLIVIISVILFKKKLVENPQKATPAALVELIQPIPSDKVVELESKKVLEPVVAVAAKNQVAKNGQDKFDEIAQVAVEESVAEESLRQGQDQENAQVIGKAVKELVPAEISNKSQEKSYKEILQAINENQIQAALSLMSVQAQAPLQYRLVQQQILSNLLLTNRNAIALMFGRQALNYVPEDFSIRLLTATAAYKLKDYAWSYKILDELQPAMGDNERYYALKGMLSLKLHHYEASRKIYRALIKASPANPKYLLGLAIAEQGLGNKQMALVYYTRLKNSQEPTWPSWYFVSSQIQRLQ